MILNRSLIRQRSMNGMIFPFSESSVFNGVSHGVSIAGYDVRIEFDTFGEVLEKTIKPGEFFLASTIERFRFPNDVLGTVHNKSTWARCGLDVSAPHILPSRDFYIFNTVIEPGWEGYLTLELVNMSVAPITLKRGTGIAQILFHTVTGPDLKPYVGKYQHQRRGPVDYKWTSELDNTPRSTHWRGTNEK